MSQELRAAIASGIVSAPQQKELLEAVNIREQILAIQAEAAGIDWSMFLKPILTALIAGIPGPFGPIVSMLIKLLLPNIVPNGDNSEIPTPH